ncbi:unnamed protein product [Effrenium voratum]|nr:unnamed protein product [Effrenium voratum]
MVRYQELDRIKKEAEDKKKKEEALKEAALKRKVAEKLALEARPHKLFVAGDGRGSFEKLFSTVQAQAAKVGGIEALLCVGRLLPMESEGAQDGRRIRAAIPARGEEAAARDLLCGLRRRVAAGSAAGLYPVREPALPGRLRREDDLRSSRSLPLRLLRPCQVRHGGRGLRRRSLHSQRGARPQEAGGGGQVEARCGPAAHRGVAAGLGGQAGGLCQAQQG